MCACLEHRVKFEPAAVRQANGYFAGRINSDINSYCWLFNDILPAMACILRYNSNSIKMLHSYICVRIVSNAKPNSLYSRNELASMQSFSGKPSDLHLEIKLPTSFLSDRLSIWLNRFTENFMINVQFFKFRNARKEKLLGKALRQLSTFKSRSKENFYRMLS